MNNSPRTFWEGPVAIEPQHPVGIVVRVQSAVMGEMQPAVCAHRNQDRPAGQQLAEEVVEGAIGRAAGSGPLRASGSRVRAGGRRSRSRPGRSRLPPAMWFQCQRAINGDGRADQQPFQRHVRQARARTGAADNFRRSAGAERGLPEFDGLVGVNGQRSLQRHDSRSGSRAANERPTG